MLTRTISLLALAAMLIAATSLLLTSVAMASTFGRAESQRSVDKYDELLDKALAALASGDAVEAEKVSFALTVLDDARCEGHAVLGAALARRGKSAESKAAFDAAKSKANGTTVRLIDLIALAAVAAPVPTTVPVLVPVPTPPKPAASQLALDWCDVVAAEPDPAVVTDAAARARMTATKLPWQVRDRKTGIVMLLCPPGEFMMGSPASEAGRSDNEAQHRVTITKAFYLSETEVTQEVWQKVMGANPSGFWGASNPVEQVSWNDCQKFCQSSGLRLASESEWEYACRAGTTGAYAGDLASMAWFGDNSGYSTHPVKQRKPNAWGLYDMHGNVWEWCGDGYAQSASSTQQASTGNAGARVLRGGGWFFNASLCRSANRNDYAPEGTDYGPGFRVARTSDDQQSVPVVVAKVPAPAPAALSAPTAPKPAASQPSLDWCDVVAADPDPAVVTDAEARARMTATKLPWKVRDLLTGIVMLLCPPGEFMMGSPASEAGRSDDEAQHRVQITKAFYLSETEVTQECWQKVMGTNPSGFKSASNPVDGVSWNDCQKFCQSSGLRLATESEWEYACRAGTTTGYSFGAGITKQQANFSSGGTVACGSLPANQWGFREMHGNVDEWCEDGYETMGSGKQDAVKSETTDRVLRGGSWGTDTVFVRSSYRDNSSPGFTHGSFGFRVARSPL
jgi:formylglycine-generating enzyme required for sulfatase activity